LTFLHGFQVFEEAPGTAGAGVEDE
jgi:hypothetical protein